MPNDTEQYCFTRSTIFSMQTYYEKGKTNQSSGDAMQASLVCKLTNWRNNQIDGPLLF